jgi:hypothetical protein
MAHAIVFDAGGKAIEPSSLLRKRPLVVMRGSFSHPELFDSDLLKAANQQLTAEGTPLERRPATLFELTIRPVSRVEALAASDMLACIRQLTPRGPVIVTDYAETYLLGGYLRRHSTEPVRFIFSVAAAVKVMHEAFYQALPGAMLEGVGRLLSTNVKLYVAAMPLETFRAAVGNLDGAISIRESAQGQVTLDDLVPSGPSFHLFEYLRASRRIVALEQSP